MAGTCGHWSVINLLKYALRGGFMVNNTITAATAGEGSLKYTSIAQYGPLREAPGMVVIVGRNNAFPHKAS